MIRRLQVLHYRALKDIDVKLSKFHILVGPNASGKSTFLDAINLIGDILNEGPQKAIEKRVSRFDELLWMQQGNMFVIVVELEIPKDVREKLKDKEFPFVRYRISIQLDDKEGVIIDEENLWLVKEASPNRRFLFDWEGMVFKTTRGINFFKSETSDFTLKYRFGPSKSALAMIPQDEELFPVALWTKNILMNGIQFIQLNSSAMRRPCRPDLPVAFQTDGSNLPKVIQYLKKEHPDFLARWIRHIQTALPEVEDVEVQERPEDRHLYLNVRHKNGLKLPSWVISDGTLRLLAQTIIAYLPEKNRIYMIEEPENGLHPLAIESIFQSLSSVYENQIFLATHSPVLLRLAEPKDILCFSKTESGSVNVVRGDEHPKLKDWKEDIDLATLHAAGVLQ